MRAPNDISNAIVMDGPLKCKTSIWIQFFNHLHAKENKS